VTLSPPHDEINSQFEPCTYNYSASVSPAFVTTPSPLVGVVLV